jgi:hypothetical protein
MGIDQRFLVTIAERRSKRISVEEPCNFRGLVEQNNYERDQWSTKREKVWKTSYKVIIAEGMLKRNIVK